MRKRMKTVRGLWAGLLAAAVVLTSAAPSALTVQAEEADSDVIVISSARELIEFANNCKYDSYSRGRTVRLATDINLSNTDFQGIPYFDGTFDGATIQ